MLVLDSVRVINSMLIWSFRCNTLLINIIIIIWRFILILCVIRFEILETAIIILLIFRLRSDRYFRQFDLFVVVFYLITYFVVSNYRMPAGWWKNECSSQMIFRVNAKLIKTLIERCSMKKNNKSHEFLISNIFVWLWCYARHSNNNKYESW